MGVWIMPMDYIQASIKESGWIIGFSKWFAASAGAILVSYHAFVGRKLKVVNARIDKNENELADQRKLSNAFIMEVSDRMSKDMASKEQLKNMENRFNKSMDSHMDSLHKRFDDFKDFTRGK